MKLYKKNYRVIWKILKLSWIFEDGLRSVNEADRVRAESPAEVESTGLGGPAEPKQKYLDRKNFIEKSTLEFRFLKLD